MTEYPFNLADIVSYFDSVKAWYPNGLPEESIVSDPVESSQTAAPIGFGSGASGICFLGALQESEECWQLLQAAIVKGMKLSASTIYFVDTSNFSGDTTLLQTELAASEVSCVLALGKTLAFSLSPGTWSTLGEIKVLGSLSLSAVLTDTDKKKEFWGHLKMLMKELQQ